jgi:Na+:H+ antiporter, NhaA family
MTKPKSSLAQGPARTRGIRQIRAEGSRLNRRVLLPAERFLHNEAISGALLVAFAIVALVWANSPWAATYYALRDMPVSMQAGSKAITLSLQHWINEGLMAVFFFVVALEIKRELLSGDLADARKAALPVAAALGGMILPAALYLALNFNGAGAAGWGIPMATDIAFAVAILALLGPRVPAALRMFLLTFAITDDVGSIVVIALNYTSHFSITALGGALALLALMLLMRWLGFRSPVAYGLPALAFWVAMLHSGVHATIAGVILGAITPAVSAGRKSRFVAAVRATLPGARDALDSAQPDKNEVILGRIEELARQTEPPLERLERLVHPWTSYLVLPVFALANAGVALSGEFTRQAFTSTVTLGVMLGLIAGKAVGVTGFAFLAVRLGWAALPAGVSWRHLTGAALIGGVGFTVALFITGLAFTDKVHVEEAKVGVLAGSLVAAIGGYLFLRLATPAATPADHKETA